MDQDQRELRRAATEAFIESLDQLVDCLEAKEILSEQAQKAKKPQSVSRIESVSLQRLEDAAADIEQFMQAKFKQ